MARIVLAGGTGLLGQLLIPSFVEKGYEVIVFTRQTKHNSTFGDIKYVYWDGRTIGDWATYLDGADILINLSGESINKRFTTKNKALLEKSRVEPTLILGKAITELSNPPSIWINFSGVSIFAEARDISDEYSEIYGDTFLARLTKKWEEAFDRHLLPKTTKITLRISPVLTDKGGIFASLYPLAKRGLAGTIGNGRQYMPWIHQEDFIRAVHWLIGDDRKQFLYHASAPTVVNNQRFMYELRHAAGVKIGLPLPTVFAKIGAYFKGVDSSLLLESTPVISKTFVEEGFQFKYPSLNLAFESLISSKKIK